MKRLLAIFIVLTLSCGAVFSQKNDTYRVRTLVIDPGHGGAKPGAQGSRSWEKNITLSVAKKFGKLIEDNYPDVKVIYTRTNDSDISLLERANIANRAKADLFISIHANSHPTSSPTGVETFVMGLSKSAANLEVAKKENADILLEADYKSNAGYNGFDPNSEESYIIFAMAQQEHIERSLNFAGAIQKQYKHNLKTINRGVKQAELFVLYKTVMPAVLTEIGFISNPTEEAYMLSDEGQAQIAVCLFNAFMNYKAAEEGSNKVANPVINIPGYKDLKAKSDATPVVQKPEPKPEVAEAKPEPKVEPKTEPKEEPKPEPKVAEPEKNPIEPTAPTAQAKPTPTPSLPQQTKLQEVEPAAPQAKAEPAPVAEQPKAEPAPAAKQPNVEPAREETPKVAPEKETLRNPVNTAAEDATQYFTVQFLTSPNQYKAGDAELCGISEFHSFRQNNKYAYITGRFATREEAVAYCNHVRKTTQFRDAWVYNFKANAAKEQQPVQQTKQPAKAGKKVPGLSYRVQFCTSSKQMKPGDPDLHGISDIHSSPSGQFFVHSAGDYATLGEARQRCNTIKRTTRFKDAFVIAIYKGERITLEQAAQIEKQSK